MHIVIICGIFNFDNMNIKLYFTLLFSVLILMSCSCQNKAMGIKTSLEQRELLKEYFLCICIIEGFKNKQIEELDISQSVYFDILRYSPEAFHEVKNYAKKFIDTIEPSPIVDLDNKKAIILSCIKKYKSKEVEKFIISMDKYMLDD